MVITEVRKKEAETVRGSTLVSMRRRVALLLSNKNVYLLFALVGHKLNKPPKTMALYSAAGRQPSKRRLTPTFTKRRTIRGARDCTRANLFNAAHQIKSDL